MLERWKRRSKGIEIQCLFLLSSLLFSSSYYFLKLNLVNWKSLVFISFYSFTTVWKRVQFVVVTVGFLQLFLHTLGPISKRNQKETKNKEMLDHQAVTKDLTSSSNFSFGRSEHLSERWFVQEYKIHSPTVSSSILISTVNSFIIW